MTPPREVLTVSYTHLPKGRYVTLTLEGLASREGDIFARSIQALAAELSLLLKDIPPQGLVLVAGLGNRAITPDAIGPKVHNYTLVTRHLVRQMPETFGAFRPVASPVSYTHLDVYKRQDKVGGKLDQPATDVISVVLGRQVTYRIQQGKGGVWDGVLWGLKIAQKGPQEPGNISRPGVVQHRTDDQLQSIADVDVYKRQISYASMTRCASTTSGVSSPITPSLTGTPPPATAAGGPAPAWIFSRR